MCTAITLKNVESYFGRNMDIGYSFNEKVVVTPVGYNFKLKNGDEINTNYAIIGMACVIDDYPLYAEAANEKGLAIAGLNFPRYAKYSDEIIEGKNNITPFELIPFILSKCSNVSEARNELENISLLNIPFKENLPLATLHFMIADKDSSIVFEQTKDGAKIYENKVGVMTNNPTFDYHLTNLNNYLNCSNLDSDNKLTKDLDLKPLGHGIGGFGIPGDTSTVSRFVKTVFVKSNSSYCETNNDSISQFFHILDSVAVAKGNAVTKENIEDYTTYASCMNLNQNIYYYKTYYNNRIVAIKLNEENSVKETLTIYDLKTTQDILFDN